MRPEEMEIKIPAELLAWIDANRGERSRQAFMVKCLAKLKEISDFSNLN